MKEDEYIKTFVIGGKEIKLGLDDYGQCYFIEWTDDLGNIQQTGLGTYNFHYMEDIYYLFDDRYKELCRIELRRELTDKEIKEMEKYYELFEKEYKFYDEEGTSD